MSRSEEKQPPHLFTVRQITYCKQYVSKTNQLRNEYTETHKPDFLMMLAGNPDKRAFMIANGFSAHDLDRFYKQGRSCPRYDLHHKFPIGVGGHNAEKNFIIVEKDNNDKFTFHKLWHDFFDQQAKQANKGNPPQEKQPFSMITVEPVGFFLTKQMIIERYPTHESLSGLNKEAKKLVQFLQRKWGIGQKDDKYNAGNTMFSKKESKEFLILSELANRPNATPAIIARYQRLKERGME